MSRLSRGLALFGLALVGMAALSMGETIASLNRLNITLPGLTLFMLGVPMVVYLLGCVTVAATVAIKEYRMRDHGRSMLINVTAAIVAIVVWGVLQYSFALPMYRILPFVS